MVLQPPPAETKLTGFVNYDSRLDDLSSDVRTGLVPPPRWICSRVMHYRNGGQNRD